jgi:hypothetical protein
MDPALSSANEQRTRRWLSEYGSCPVLSKCTEEKETLSCPRSVNRGQGDIVSELPYLKL